MKKSWTKIQLCALAAAALVAAGASAAPIVVTKGSNSGYLYFPAGSKGGSTDSGNPAGSVDKLQTAPTVCMTASGVVPMPDGFTAGTIQAIVVAGGEGGTGPSGSPIPPGGSSLTYGAVSIATTGVYDNGGAGAADGGFGGGGGGYGGAPGNGGNSPKGGEAPPTYTGNGGDGGGAGPYSAELGGRGGAGQVNGRDGGAMPTPTVPAPISCPPAVSRGWGGGGNGSKFYRGGGSGRVATGTFKYTGGAITVIVGIGGKAKYAEPTPEDGVGGLVAIRFIAD